MGAGGGGLAEGEAGLPLGLRAAHSGLPILLYMALPSIQALGAAYTTGLVAASFVFATLAQTLNEMRLLGFGMLVWGAAILGTGLSGSFGVMVLFRVSIGGHGAIPGEQRGSWCYSE